MSYQVVIKIDVEHIRSKQYDCLILVHPIPNRLEQVLTEIVRTNDIPIMEIGRDLSAYLLDIHRGERTRAIQSWFEKKIKQLEPGPVLCAQID